ncbi:sulfatase-like hydrolase/transferase [Pyxidicoccus xibeiensis]|uniref:sulfatase-like hydrolase/transferase n=1 Tax=Pyxidicoccus xibeiensis TaxID=2906759 RepID=UPI0020A71448|nr:sulfatase-like hydrolase/transferase [Pyxidicoccus xibeiensis]MCP3141111.1 sulfatase-like hydrolase/transferase [Pyxidicoccus xibeiensis]
MVASSPSRSLRPHVLRVLAGVGLGLGLFAAESWLLLRSGVVGMDIPVDGPYAALAAAVRPVLPALLLRIAAVYVVAGAVLALVAGVLARVWRVAGWRGALLTLAQGLVLVGFLAWDRAIARPALFDDLPAVRALLAWLVAHGEPWHPRAAAAAWLLLHGVLWVRRTEVPRRRLLVGATVAGAVALLSAGAGRLPSGEARQPLVVVIGIDAFRPDRLKSQGGSGYVAPHVERFLEDATLFTQAYTPIAQTEPAWRSLLTARWPHTTGVRYALTADSRLKLQPTFARTFSEAGWRTVFATDCSRFHAEGPASGFDTRLQPPRGAVNFLLEKLRYRALGVFADNALGAAWVPEFIDNRALAGIHDPMGYSRRLASRLVDEARQGPTLFAFHATAAHFPGDPVHPFYRRFVPPSEPLERRLRMHFAPVSPGAKGGWSREGAEALYDELLAQADAQVGDVLEALKRTGRYDDALIVLLSDHGESFHADRPDLAGATPVHGARLSHEENRVLLAVKPPRGRGTGPSEVDALVRLVDVGPTVLALSGLPALKDVDGVSLAPLLRGEPLEPLALYAETGFTHVLPEVFDPGHWPGAPRAFDAYRIRPDGVVELGDAAHAAIVREKDQGAFDGRRWWVDRPRADGSVLRTCEGDCEGADAHALEAWLDGVLGRTAEGRWRKVAGHVDDPRQSQPSGTLRTPQQLLRLRSGQPAGPAHPQPRGG